MSIQKQYVKNGKVCDVTFTLSKKEAMDVRHIYLVGEFNKWNENSIPMEALNNGGFTKKITFETDREYQFRYYLEQMVWKNDNQADKYIHSSYGDCENSVVCV